MPMSDSIIPREALAACQRWEPASFGMRNAHHTVALPTAGELERIHQQSREEGYASGLQEGRAQAEAQAQSLRGLLEGVGRALRDLDQTVADELLALALEIAKKILGQALRLRPELVVPVIQEAVRALPQFSQSVRVLLHPQDATLLNSYLAQHPAATGWIIIEDARVERGGCRVEAAGGEVDATLHGRWRRVLAALDRTDEWLT